MNTIKTTHKVRIATDRIIAAVEENMFGMGSTGFCLACGDEQEGCEPDARRYRCESCDAHMVFGAEEVLMMVQG